MSSIDLEPQPRVLRFLGGDVVKVKPSREQLEDSLQAWSSVVVANTHCAQLEPTLSNLRRLKSSVEQMERIAAELESR